VTISELDNVIRLEEQHAASRKAFEPPDRPILRLTESLSDLPRMRHETDKTKRKLAKAKTTLGSCLHALTQPKDELVLLEPPDKLNYKEWFKEWHKRVVHRLLLLREVAQFNITNRHDLDWKFTSVHLPCLAEHG
jgi:hypothetical protein